MFPFYACRYDKKPASPKGMRVVHKQRGLLNLYPAVALFLFVRLLLGDIDGQYAIGNRSSNPILIDVVGQDHTLLELRIGKFAPQIGSFLFRTVVGLHPVSALLRLGVLHAFACLWGLAALLMPAMLYIVFVLLRLVMLHRRTVSLLRVPVLFISVLLRRLLTGLAVLLTCLLHLLRLLAAFLLHTVRLPTVSVRLHIPGIVALARFGTMFHGYDQLIVFADIDLKVVFRKPGGCYFHLELIVRFDDIDCGYR